VIFAAFAGTVAAVSGGDDAIWGRWAVGGYAAAAMLARRERWAGPALAVATAGALAAPVAWLALRMPATADVGVVGRSAVLLLHHGTPYLPVSRLASWRDYDPYLPGMALFGLPHAIGLPALAGDSRLWLTAVTAVAAALAFATAARGTGACGTAARGSPSATATGRRTVLFRTALACSSPVLAFPLALGITDPAMIGLICLGLAFAAAPGGRPWLPPVAAGLAVGGACAMKFTAWPAAVVLAALFACRDGARAAVAFAGLAAATGLGLIAATAPALAGHPAALFRNTVLYPLGLTAQRTPAASPLPGHFLASLGPSGRLAAIMLVAAAGLAVAVSLVIRPPRDVPAATWRLAAGLALMFAFAPASRFGYLAYPAALLGWLALSGLHRAGSRVEVGAAELAGGPAGAPVSMPPPSGPGPRAGIRATE
jgi:hypothetical protein